MNLSSTIKSIQDIMRKDDGVDGDAQRLGQLTWMLFLKVFDQREEEWEDDNPKYKSPLPDAMRWRNWAAYVPGKDGKKAPQKAASEIISFVNNDLFPTLKDLDANVSPQHKVIRSVFEDANNYMKSGTQLLAVIEKLEDAINFHDFKTRASLGDVYEQLLNDLRGAGNAGEFYTPRAITQFMADRLNPSLAKRETVMDPACGTGGFLTAAIDHLRNQLTAKSSAADKAAIEGLIRGIEKKQLPHLLCTTNMLLHGIDVPSQIEHRNTLGVGWNEWSANDKVDCVITNPPFGGYEDDGVGGDYPADLRTRETADMFMALIVKKLLKENGRAAVVLPDGFLFGEGIKATLKKLLLRDCKLHTIVRLPKGVFAPYTTIKTNLLFFTKGSTLDDGTEHFHTDTIWYYEHPYPPGYKSYSKTKPIRFDEFRPEQDWWGNEDNDFADRVENEFAWKVDFKTKRKNADAAARPHWDRAEQLGNEASALENRVRDLRESIKGVSDAKLRQQVDAEIEALRSQGDSLRQQSSDALITGDNLYWPIYNLDLKNPNGPEQESLEPNVLLTKYKTLLGQIAETESELKSELAPALKQRGHPDNSSLFLTEFGLLTTAPGGIGQLRKLVLDLAIRGALLTGRGYSADANALLAEVAAHRDELVRQGKLRRPVPQAGIDGSEISFSIPGGWQFARLGEVCEIVRGVTFPASSKQSSPTPGAVACLRTSNVQAEVEWGDLIYIDSEFVGRADQWVQIGDTMISMANSYELVGKVALVRAVPQRTTFGGFIAAVRPHVLEPDYLYLLLRSPYMQAKMRATSSQTTNIANISLGGMRPIPVPIPPKEEQARIVARVDSLMALFDRLEDQQSNLRKVATVFAAASVAAITDASEDRDASSADHPQFPDEATA